MGRFIIACVDMSPAYLQRECRTLLVPLHQHTTLLLCPQHCRIAQELSSDIDLHVQHMQDMSNGTMRGVSQGFFTRSTGQEKAGAEEHQAGGSVEGLRYKVSVRASLHAARTRKNQEKHQARLQ